MRSRSAILIVVSLLVLAACCVLWWQWPFRRKGPPPGRGGVQRGAAQPTRRDQKDQECTDLLVRMAQSSDPAVREEGIGKLLKRLTPGMDRRDVERLIGPGGREVTVTIARGVVKEVYVPYYCTPPGHNYTQLMTVHYAREGSAWMLTHIKGPHVPDHLPRNPGLQGSGPGFRGHHT